MLDSNPEKRTQVCERGLLDELGMKDVGRVVEVVEVEVKVITIDVVVVGVIDVVEVMDIGRWLTWLRKVCSKVTYLRYVLR